MLEAIIENHPDNLSEQNNCSNESAELDGLGQILQELQMPHSVTSVTDEITVPSIPDLSLDMTVKQPRDIFALEHRKSWDKSIEARCDFQYKLRLTRRASTNFITIWQKSVFGRTLTDIKSDDAMISYFVENLAPVIRECIGYHIEDGSWSIVTTPMRRHIMEQQVLCSQISPSYQGRNFASLISDGLAKELSIPFYFDCARCRSKQRVGAVFDANNIPREPNVIVFDDFVTTGSTLLAMKNLLREHGKNPVFFAGINNKL